jgi:uncharacterized membrane protein YdjX (TVP38/TMEM64 family)
VSVSSTAAAALAFLLARSALRPLVEASLRRRGGARFARLDAAIRADGARVVLLLRLSPLFPFSLSNYALGLTSVRFPAYVAATWAGALPATFAYVYLGEAGRATAEAAAGGLPPLKLALYGAHSAATPAHRVPASELLTLRRRAGRAGDAGGDAHGVAGG